MTEDRDASVEGVAICVRIRSSDIDSVSRPDPNSKGRLLSDHHSSTSGHELVTDTVRGFLRGEFFVASPLFLDDDGAKVRWE